MHFKQRIQIEQTFGSLNVLLVGLRREGQTEKARWEYNLRGTMIALLYRMLEWDVLYRSLPAQNITYIYLQKFCSITEENTWQRIRNIAYQRNKDIQVYFTGAKSSAEAVRTIFMIGAVFPKKAKDLQVLMTAESLPYFNP